MKNVLLIAVALILGVVRGARSSAEPIVPHAFPVQTQVSEPFQRAIDAEPTAAGKFASIAHAMQTEQSVNVRRRILEAALRIPGVERETFLANLVVVEEDSGGSSQRPNCAFSSSI